MSISSTSLNVSATSLLIYAHHGHEKEEEGKGEKGEKICQICLIFNIQYNNTYFSKYVSF
jgi:hypothetical protein